MITQTRLKEVLHYNYDTGIFTRLQPTKIKAIGDSYDTPNDNGYVSIGLDGKTYRAHRLAWLYVYGEFPIFDIDHINTVKSDNRLSNLRLCTNNQNVQNIKKPYKNNKSGYLGVSWSKTMNKFEACLNVNNKTVHLGFSDDPIEAHKMYVESKRKLHSFCTV